MDATVLRVIRIALGLLGERVLTILSLAMTFGLSVFVMQDPLPLRVFMASFFAVAVFIPTLYKERRGARKDTGDAEAN